MIAIPTTLVGGIVGSVSESSCKKKRMKVGLPPHRSAVEREAFDPPGSRMQPADELEYLEGKKSLSPREQRRLKRLKRSNRSAVEKEAFEPADELEYLEGKQSLSPREQRRLKRLKR